MHIPQDHGDTGDFEGMTEEDWVLLEIEMEEALLEIEELDSDSDSD